MKPLPHTWLPCFLVIVCSGLVFFEPALAGSDLFTGIPDLGFFNFLQPILRWIGMALLRLIFFIPGGEDFLIGVF